MALTDLFIDDTTHKLSHTKLWSNIGLLTMTIVFLYRGFYGSITDMEMEMLIYGLVVTAPQLLSKFIGFRFGNGNTTNNTNS